jgi:hypothetical protein
MNDELQHGPGSNNARLKEVLDDRKFFGHPRGVGGLAAGNFFNSFAWGALYAILIFYLYSPFTKGLEFTQGQVASMVTAMGACNSIFIILGSWLADRVLGMRKALIIGNIIKGTAFGLLAVQLLPDGGSASEFIPNYDRTFACYGPAYLWFLQKYRERHGIKYKVLTEPFVSTFLKRSEWACQLSIMKGKVVGIFYRLDSPFNHFLLKCLR